MQYSGKIEIQKRPALFRNLQSFVDCSMERSIRYNFFDWFWRAFSISFHLIIVWIYVSRSIFSILMVHHFLSTNPYKMSIFQRSVTCSFFKELNSHIDKNSGEKFEDMFLVIIVSKGTSLIDSIKEFCQSLNYLKEWAYSKYALQGLHKVAT